MLTTQEIRSIRKLAGISQKDFAELIGIPVGTWSTYETGHAVAKKEALEKATQTLLDLGVLTHTEKDIYNYGSHVVKQAGVTEVCEDCEEPVVDMINKPPHYHKGGIDVVGFLIDHFGSSTKVTPAQGFFIGNVIKYTCRYMDKNGVEDLNKAEFYLKKLKETIEGE